MVHSTIKPWLAKLSLQYQQVDDTTRLCKVERLGPLVVQKALYPEGPQPCQTLIVHPPGGIAGADLLDIEIDLKSQAQVLVTMPGASKWYRSAGAEAQQQLKIAIADYAALEWLPPETIIFNGARATLRTQVELAQHASYLGWEIICLGRIASGERFDAGSVHQSIDISIGGKPVWVERGALEAGSPLFNSTVALGSAPVSAVMLLAGSSVPAPMLAQCRAETIERPGRVAITVMSKVLVARYLGHSCQQAKQYFIALWRILRPFFSGRIAVPPRIWNT